MSNTVAVTTAGQPQKRVIGRPFQPGNNANPRGRPKGSRHKLGEAFVQALQQDFEEHGMSVIERVREEKPDAYLKVIASTLPKELNVNTNALGDMSDDELAAVLAAMRSLADTVSDQIARAGAGEESRTEPASDVSAVH